MDYNNSILVLYIYNSVPSGACDTVFGRRENSVCLPSSTGETDFWGTGARVGRAEETRFWRTVGATRSVEETILATRAGRELDEVRVPYRRM